jgi:hypothetical protein
MVDVRAERTTPSGTGGGRLGAGPLLIVILASLCAFGAIFALWINRQLLNTDDWTRTSTQLIENATIRDELATYIVDQLPERAGLDSRIREALPVPLPVPDEATGGLSDVAKRGVAQVLATTEAQAAWTEANRAAHAEFVQVMDGGGTVVSTEGGLVVLDVRDLLGQVTDRVGIGRGLADSIPEGAGEITILRSGQLQTAQDVVRGLKGLPVILVVLSLGLIGATLAFVADRRREVLQAYGIGLLVAGIAALLVRWLARGPILDGLETPDAVRPAAEAAWGISTTLLREVAIATILYGAVLIAGTWLAGPSERAVAIRRRLAPVAHEAVVVYAVLAVIAVLLIVIGPTGFTRGPGTALALIALLAAGTEALRRQIVREHPGARPREA